MDNLPCDKRGHVKHKMADHMHNEMESSQGTTHIGELVHPESSLVQSKNFSIGRVVNQLDAPLSWAKLIEYILERGWKARFEVRRFLLLVLASLMIEDWI